MRINRKTEISFTKRHWLGLFLLAAGVYAGLPFLAPVFMSLGWRGPARAIYLVYSFLCHQLPQRSFFLFGDQFTYSLAEIQRAAGVTNPRDLLALRQFLGDPLMGWKVAWSDRMVAMFTSIPLFAVLWRPLRGIRWRLPWWGFALLILPMILDGLTHLFSDLAGIGLGFRDANLWLAALTNNTFPVSFYSGDAWGSFNSSMRLLTGVLFGLGIVWFGFPYLEEALE